MNQREEIRKLLETLPLPQRLRIEREGAKYRAQRPLDMPSLWEEFKALWKAEAPTRARDEKRRRELLKELDDADGKT